MKLVYQLFFGHLYFAYTNKNQRLFAWVTRYNMHSVVNLDSFIDYQIRPNVIFSLEEKRKFQYIYQTMKRILTMFKKKFFSNLFMLSILWIQNFEPLNRKVFRHH